MAASLPGQVTSRAAERPGSVRLPLARKAPRQTARDLLAGSGGQAVREAADGAAAGVEQSGLPGEGLAAVEHAHEVVAGAAQARGRDHGDVAAHPVELGEVLAHAARDECGVELGLDGDAARDEVQSAGEAQDRRQFSGAHRGAVDLGAGEFLFDVGCESQSMFHSVAFCS